MNDNAGAVKAPNEPSEAEREVIRMIRELDYGRIVLTVKGGKAVHAELQKSILIPNEKE